MTYSFVYWITLYEVMNCFLGEIRIVLIYFKRNIEKSKLLYSPCNFSKIKNVIWNKVTHFKSDSLIVFSP
jgi:hypothetical protein